MRYEGVIYRPPSEFDSLVIQATIGCPYNRCNFCNMYSDHKFKIRPVADIINDLDMAQVRFGQNVEKIFFSDGNTILMKTKNLLTLLRHCYKLFPNLKFKFIYLKTKYRGLAFYTWFHLFLYNLIDFIMLSYDGLKFLHIDCHEEIF